MGASYGPGLNQHGLLEGSLDDQIEALVAFAWRAQALRLVEVIGGRVLELTQYDEVVTQRWLTGDEASGPLAAMRLGGEITVENSTSFNDYYKQLKNDAERRRFLALVSELLLDAYYEVSSDSGILSRIQQELADEFKGISP